MEKLDIASKIDQGVIDDDVLPMIVRTLAPYDPVLAKSYASKITCDSEWVEAHIEISKHLPPEDAQNLLMEVKQKYAHSLQFLCLVCLEELRCGLPQAKTTLNTIETMKNHLQEDRFRLEWLFEILEVEAMAKSPQALETLEMLRNTLEQSRKAPLDGSKRPILQDDQDYYEGKYFANCERIISIEAAHPFLFSQLTQDFSSFLAMIEAYKKGRPPGVSSAIDYSLYSALVSLAPNHPDKAQMILRAMNSNDNIFNGRRELIKAQHASKEFETEEMLRALIQQAKSEKAIFRKASYLMDAFHCTELTWGLGKALPYLKQAKSLVVDLDNDDAQDVLDSILEIELSHQLPSAKETLKNFHQIIKTKGENPLFFKGSHLVHIFHCIALTEGLEEALPSLEQAKSLVANLDNDAAEDVLCYILEMELLHQVPSFKDTLKKLHQIIKTADTISIDTIAVMIKAELVGRSDCKNLTTIQL